MSTVWKRAAAVTEVGVGMILHGGFEIEPWQIRLQGEGSKVSIVNEDPFEGLFCAKLLCGRTIYNHPPIYPAAQIYQIFNLVSAPCTVSFAFKRSQKDSELDFTFNYYADIRAVITGDELILYPSMDSYPIDAPINTWHVVEARIYDTYTDWFFNGVYIARVSKGGGCDRVFLSNEYNEGAILWIDDVRLSF